MGNKQGPPWLLRISKVLEDAGRIASKYFSKPENVEPLADLAVLASDLVALKKYADTGINPSKPLKTLKGIIEKHERHKVSAAS